ncbi:hypothetical protein [Clostridium sp.]|uniref:hypothetical protein n=1 Tax=Clostridium sp. TaxID=1506 RepID=UPI002FCC1A98
MGNMLNILPFLVEAISTNQIVYKDIDRIYEKDSKKYHEAAKSTEYYNHYMATEGNIEQEYYFKKVLGMLKVSDGMTGDDELVKELLAMYKKGWKYVHAYLETHKVIILTDFLKQLIRKVKGIENISDDTLNSNMLMVVYLGQIYGNEVVKEEESFIKLIEYMAKRLNHYGDNGNRISLNNESYENKKAIRTIETKLLQGNKDYKRPLCKTFDLMDIANLDNDLDKYKCAFEYIYDLEHLSLVTLVGEKFITNKELQELILTYTTLHRNEAYSLDELEKYLYAAIQIKYLCREYKKAKAYFFDNHEEGLHNEIEKLTKDLAAAKLNNKLMEEKIKKDEASSSRNIKENERLKGELKELSGMKKELNSLRENMFSLNIEEDEMADISGVDLVKLNKLEATVIGGHSRWVARMKELLPNWIFIDVESINFDVKLLKKKYVFINTLKNSHAMYYKVIENIEPGTKLKYFNNSNVDICIKSIENLIR